MNRNAEFQALFNKAMAAGRLAAAATNPTPMVVYSPTTPMGNTPDPNQPVYLVPSGPCGFAWVNISPANCPFANWLKKNGLARKAYKGGVDISIGEYGQSMQRKESHAYAMAHVLSEAGIRAYAQSRMD